MSADGIEGGGWGRCPQSRAERGPHERRGAGALLPVFVVADSDTGAHAPAPEAPDGRPVADLGLEVMYAPAGPKHALIIRSARIKATALHCCTAV